MTREEIKIITDIVHKTIYTFFDVCDDDEEVPISDKDKLLLEVNKAICNNLKALNQESYEDCISRQAVLNVVEREEFKGDAISEIEKLPSVQPEQKWIPVSERLPKSSGVYIVTREFNDGFERKVLTDACYFDGSTWYGDNRINHKREYVEKIVIAWMPLPEPYKAESGDNE